MNDRWQFAAGRRLCLFAAVALIAHSVGAGPLEPATDAGRSAELAPPDNISSPDEASSGGSGSDSLENWDDLYSDESTDPPLAANASTNTSAVTTTTTSVDEQNFVVRLARALKHMNFGRLPKTIVLNPRAVIEHTHIEEQPDSGPAPADGDGYFAEPESPAAPPPTKPARQPHRRRPAAAAAAASRGAPRMPSIGGMARSAGCCGAGKVNDERPNPVI